MKLLRTGEIVALLSSALLGAGWYTPPVTPVVRPLPRTSPDAEAIALLREGQAELRMLNRISEVLPREPLEPDQLVETTGEDPTSITEWVASSIGWLPYVGALRGPRGVLIERRGNSLDQSLLVAETARHAGYEVRLARMELTTEVAEEMYAGLRSRDADERAAQGTPTEGAAVDEVARFASLIGTDAAQLRKAHEALEIRAQGYLEEVLPLAIRQTAELKGLLAKSGVSAPSSTENPAAGEVEALRDHWWVQVSREGGDWADHDALARRAGVELERAPETTCSLEDLPREMRHVLTLRVVAERLEPNGLTTEVALTHEAEAATLAGAHFNLAFRPLNANRAGTPAEGEEQSGAHMLRIASMETEWLPTLVRVDYAGGGEEIHQSSIYTDGHLNPEPQLDERSRKVGEVISVLDGPRDDAPGQRDSQLTAIAIEYEMARPGRTPIVHSRYLFDVLGEARRSAGGGGALELDGDLIAQRGLGLSGQTQILPEVCRLSSEFLVRLDLATRLRNHRVLLGLTQAAAEGKEPDVDSALAAISSPPLELFQLTNLRFGVGRHAGRVYLDAVDVLTSHLQPFALSAEQSSELEDDGVKPLVAFARAVDIVANEVAVLAPRDGEEATPSPWDVRLEQGVLDTVLEVTSRAELDERRSAEPGGDRFLAENTSTWMEREPIERWALVQSVDEIAGGLDDTHARIAGALTSGQLAVVPRAGLEDPGGAAWAPECWWRVDRSTGATLGIGPRGWGKDIGEAVAVRFAAFRGWMAALTYRKVACFFAITWARFYFSVIAAQVGQAITPGSPTMSLVLAAASQAGVMGKMWDAFTQACIAIM